MTIITLSNGKKVGNFSSPHPFIFEDGSILPAVSNEEAERLKVRFIETAVIGSDGDIIFKFEITHPIDDEIEKWWYFFNTKQVDIVFCPLPMIEALKVRDGINGLLESPFRAIRMEDRIKKLVSIHKQCI